MRADRLLAILLLLQSGQRMTAGELARRLEVSERTIYRDLDALGAAGVPVYAEPGRRGGVRLLESYRTDLSGLSLGEAGLLPLLGLSDAFAAAGIPLRQTEEKLLMALPEGQRHRAEESRRRVFVDLSRWWDHAEDVPHLPVVVEAVFAGRRLLVSYRRGEDQKVVRRTLDPYGLVVQGGTWYLVARARRREIRIYRVSRIADARVLEEHHEIPDDFDLAAFWAERKEEFHMTREGYRVRVQARPWALRALPHEYGGEVDEGVEWQTAELSFGTRSMAFERLLGLGPHVVVLEPDDLRARIVDAISHTADLYAPGNAPTA